MDNYPAIVTYKENLGTIKALVKQMTTYKTEYLIELAYAAYRMNKGYEKQTRRHSENPPTYSNKELIAYTASAVNEISPFIPKDFNPLCVTDEAQSVVEEGYEAGWVGFW